MKMTLLDMTQNILSAMGSDEVNHYSDTAESRQVAEVIRTAYFNIIARSQLPEHKTLFSLTPSNDSASPVLMYKPENVAKIEWIKYDTRDDGDVTKPEYNYVTILPIAQYLDMVHQFSADDTSVDVMSLNNYAFFYKNDKAPTFCTIISDNFIVFDSFISTIENTLQDTKSLCYGITVPTFTLSDTFIPNLDDLQFPLLLNEAKSLAFLELKQTVHESAERESRRQWRTMQHSKRLNKTSALDDGPNFGRVKWS